MPDIISIVASYWVIYFPSHGNDGREPQKYGVTYRDRKKGKSQTGRSIALQEVLKKTTIKKKWPHSVGFFLASKGRGISWKPDYLRTRKIKTEKAFYRLLKELSL